MRTFTQLERWAGRNGYAVERIGRNIEWYHRDNHSIIGVCSTVGEAVNEISADMLVGALTEQNERV